PGIHEIQVGVTVGIRHMLAGATRDESRGAADGTKGAHRRAHAAGNDTDGTLVECLGANGGLIGSVLGHLSSVSEINSSLPSPRRRVSRSSMAARTGARRMSWLRRRSCAL